MAGGSCAADHKFPEEALPKALPYVQADEGARADVVVRDIGTGRRSAALTSMRNNMVART